jgi:hypothetical protein
VKQYARISFIDAAGKRRRAWAVVLSTTSRTERFAIVDRFGDEGDPAEVVIGHPGDVTIRLARLNRKYGELEVV